MKVKIKLENHAGIFTNESLLVEAGYTCCFIRLGLKDWIELKFKRLISLSKVESIKSWLRQPVDSLDAVIFVPSYISFTKE